MTRREYLAEAVRLYLDAPDTPATARRRDWAVAGELHRRGVPLELLAHAIRLATLKRHSVSHGLAPDAVRSLAYYRTVLHHLTADELDPGYVAYVRTAYRRLRLNSKPRPHSQNAAL